MTSEMEYHFCLQNKISQFTEGVEIDEGTRFEFYLFKLETHLAEIEILGIRIPISEITIFQWLFWCYGEPSITQEDLTEFTEYEILA